MAASAPVPTLNGGSSPVGDGSMAHNYYYPPVHRVQRPQPTYDSRFRRPSETPRTDPVRMQSSVSSEESSGSSSPSAMKAYPHYQTYWQASSMEQGLMNSYNEKLSGSWSSPTQHKSSHTPSRQEMVENNSAMLRYIQEHQRAEEEEEKENDHAIWVLFWISCLDPVHSIISAIYTLLVILTLTLVLPIRLCRPQASFTDQIIRILAPIFRHHLEMLCAPSVEDAFSFDFNPASLIIIHLTAPFLSLGIMIAGWVSAVFWLFSLVMGNPDGTERRDDGRDAVIQVRNWWEKYLLNAIRQ